MKTRAFWSRTTATKEVLLTAVLFLASACGTRSPATCPGNTGADAATAVEASVLPPGRSDR